jgi:hypothetical protein
MQAGRLYIAIVDVPEARSHDQIYLTIGIGETC